MKKERMVIEKEEPTGCWLVCATVGAVAAVGAQSGHSLKRRRRRRALSAAASVSLLLGWLLSLSLSPSLSIEVQLNSTAVGGAHERAAKIESESKMQRERAGDRRVADWLASYASVALVMLEQRNKWC